MNNYSPDLLRKRLKDVMQKNGLNMNSWAKKAGCTETPIRQFLNGKTRSLNNETLGKLAGAVDKTIDELISGRRNAAPPNPALLQEAFDIMLKRVGKKKLSSNKFGEGVLKIYKLLEEMEMKDLEAKQEEAANERQQRTEDKEYIE